MSSDSSSDECSNNSPNEAGLLWSQIADKFRGLLINCGSSAIVEFLESFLAFIRKWPSDSREFTGSICRYLFATKNLITKAPEKEVYYGSIRNILVIYCVLVLRLIDCFDDERIVASDIFFKIILLMQGSTSITVLDILIDINEHIRSSRSKSVMALVYRYYLTRNPTGEQRVLDDTDYVKHLILYRSWYNAEVMSEKIAVFKCFTSTIKPKVDLRSNQCYSLLNIADAVDYKKLLQQPLPRNALIRAVRDAENSDDNDAANIDLLDLTLDEEAEMKVEVDLSLCTTSVDDDDVGDIDMPAISYLPNLFQRLDTIIQCERDIKQLAALQSNVPCETILISSDSEEDCEAYQSFERMVDANEDTVSLFSGYTAQSSNRVHRNNVRIKLFNRNTKPGRKNRKKNRVTFSNPVVTKYIKPVLRNYDDGSDASNTDLFNGNVTGTPNNLSDVSKSVNHSTTQIGDSGRHGRSYRKNRKSRGKKRSIFGVKRKTSIDDWIKRKRLETTECMASGNAVVEECRIILERLDDQWQKFGNESGTTNEMHVGTIGASDEDTTVNKIVEGEQRHSKSTTTFETHCVSSSKSVFETVWMACPTPSSVKRRVLLPPHKNGQELGLENCFIRLKRLKPDPEQTAKRPMQISTSMNDLNSTLLIKSQKKRRFKRSFVKSSVFQRSLISVSGEVPKPSIPPEKYITDNSTATSATPQLLPSSIEVNDNDDLPSLVYSPLRKRKNDDRSEPETATYHPSPVTIVLTDADKISAIENTVRIKCDHCLKIHC